MAQANRPTVRRQNRRTVRTTNRCSKKCACSDASDIDFDSDDDTRSISDDERPSKRARLSSSPPPPTHKIFPFLRLPAELRNRIYELCLTDPLVPRLSEERVDRRRIVYRATSLRWVRDTRNPDSRPPFWAAAADSVSMTLSSAGPPPTHFIRWHIETPIFCPALLSLSKAVRAEAAPVLYGAPLRFDNAATLHALLAALEPDTRALLKHLVLDNYAKCRVDTALNHAAFTMLAEGATNVAVLHIDCFIDAGTRHDMPRPLFLAQRVYRDAFRWLEAVGRASGVWDEGVGRVVLSPVNWGDGKVVPGKEECERCEGEWREHLRRYLREGGKMRPKQWPADDGF